MTDAETLAAIAAGHPTAYADHRAAWQARMRLRLEAMQAAERERTERALKEDMPWID